MSDDGTNGFANDTYRALRRILRVGWTQEHNGNLRVTLITGVRGADTWGSKWNGGMCSARERSGRRETCCIVLSAIWSARLVHSALDALTVSCIVTYRSKAMHKLLMRFTA